MDFALFEHFILFIVGLIGLVTLSLILFSIKSNKLVNLYLVLLIALASVRMLIRSSYLLGLQDQLSDFTGAYKSLLLYSLPFFYLYFKSIVFDSKKFNRKDLNHLIFPLVLFVFNLIFLNHDYLSSPFIRFTNLLVCSFFALFYLIKSYYILKNNLWNKQQIIHIEHYKLIRNWTLFVITICGILTLRLIISLAFESFTSKELTGKTLTFLQVILWLIIFMKILISPEILFGMPQLEAKESNIIFKNKIEISKWFIGEIDITNQQDRKLKEKVDSKILELIDEIEFLAKEKYFFRNQKITIMDMANELNIPVSHLVYMFKYHCKLTFTEYKTEIKIEDAKRLIEGGFLTINTLESLATEVGFSSYNPFFTAFKKLVGKSPNEYSMSLSKK
jgi:AraC-like DNA-binding protein